MRVSTFEVLYSEEFSRLGDLRARNTRLPPEAYVPGGDPCVQPLGLGLGFGLFAT